MARKRNYPKVGGDKLSWPAGANTLTVTFRPNKPPSELAREYMMVLDYPSTLDGLHIQKIDNIDDDSMTGEGSGVARSHLPESRVNTLRLPPPLAATPPAVTFGVATAPVAAVNFSAELAPAPSSGAQERAVLKRVKAKVVKAKKKAKAKAKSRVRKALSAIWRRLPGVGALEDDDMGSIADEAVDGVFDELGAIFDDELGDSDDDDDGEV